MPKTVSKKKLKPSVSIVGAGRLGTALGLALSSSSYRIEAVVARRAVGARKAAAMIGKGARALTARQLNRLPLSELIFIATPDDEIAGVAKRLAASQNSQGRGRFVLHTSGALSSDVLAPLAEMGFYVGSLHPLVSVSDPKVGSENLRGAFYCVEGGAAAARIAREIVRDLKGQSFSISSSNKPLYHASAVMASGHVVALFDLASDMLVRCGLNPKDARRVLLPLLQSTVENLLKSDPAQALTGTFARGDFSIVQKHLQTLSSDGLVEALQAYRILGAHSLELAAGNGLDPQVVTQIKRALAPRTTKR